MSTTETIQSCFDLEPWPAISESEKLNQVSVSVASTLLDISLLLREHKELRPQKISELLGLSNAQPLLIPNQKHTRKMVRAFEASPDGTWLDESGNIATDVEADGIWTTQGNITLAIRSADCVPILIFSIQNPFIAAIHSGWRGTKSRILDEALKSAESVGIPKSDLRVWIGPRISGEVYEVSEELADGFSKAFPKMSKIRKGRIIDIGEINRQIALEAGLENNQIFMSQFCTFKNSQLFPSYRRDGCCRGEIISAITILR